MKKVFKKNQIVIAVLAVMIAVFFLCIELLSPPWGLGVPGPCPGECVRCIAGRYACPTEGWELCPYGAFLP